MNMKTIALAASLFVTATAIAEVSVFDIKCTPRNPWNGLVDIEYTVATDDPDAEVYVNPVAYDGDRRITLFPSSFTGDGATNTVKAGKHTMVWDAKKDFGTFSSANFQIKMYAGERLARYIDIDLSSGNTSDNYPVRLSHVGPDLSDDSCRTNHLWLRLVPPGEFWMGSPEYEVGRSDNEDLHHVTLTKPFYIGVFPVTIGQFKLVCGSFSYGYSSQYIPESGVNSNSDCCPVNNQYLTAGGSSVCIRGLSQPDAETGYSTGSFVGKIRSRIPNVTLDLPTEARWEYACRAGVMSALPNGTNLSNDILSSALGDIAAYYGNRNNGNELKSIVVGSYNPNTMGIYDMLGNIWEVCRDGAVENEHLGFNEVVDPSPHPNYSNSSAHYYIMRGGAWDEFSSKCRSATRGKYQAYSNGSTVSRKVGFRLCAEADF